MIRSLDRIVFVINDVALWLRHVTSRQYTGLSLQIAGTPLYMGLLITSLEFFSSSNNNNSLERNCLGIVTPNAAQYNYLGSLSLTKSCSFTNTSTNTNNEVGQRCSLQLQQRERVREVLGRRHGRCDMGNITQDGCIGAINNTAAYIVVCVGR